MVSQPGISGVRSVTSAPTVVSVAGLTQAQVQAATQRLSVAQTTATVSTSVPKAVAASMVAAGKTLTPQQLQQLQRQQQALKRREQQLKVSVFLRYRFITLVRLWFLAKVNLKFCY